MSQENRKNNDEMIGTSMNAILQHFGVAKLDRYYGSFPYPDEQGNARLTEVVAVSDKGIRDDIAYALSKSLLENDILGLWVDTEETESKNWPYQFKVMATGPSITSQDQAAEKMAKFLGRVAQELPKQDQGMKWEDYYHPRFPDGMTEEPLHQLQMFNALSKLNWHNDMHVIGSHQSKGFSLPVVQLTLPRNNTKITLRDNFHDICASVDARFPIRDTRNFKSLFDTASKGGYFEGFPRSQVYGGFDDNQKQFSFTVGTYPSLMVAVGEIMMQDMSTTVHPKPQSPKR